MHVPRDQRTDVKTICMEQKVKEVTYAHRDSAFVVRSGSDVERRAREQDG